MQLPYRSITAQSLHYFARPHSGLPAAALSGPGAWLGEQFRQSQDWVESWSAAELAEIDRALAHADATGKSTAELDARDFPLPTVGTRLAGWRDEVQHGRGFVFVRGLPIENWTQAQIERVYWCLGWHLGLPGAQNRQGELLGHVRDTGADPTNWTVREYRTRVGIKFHCDAADAVGLLCVRPALEGGLSRIASSVTVFNRLLETRPELVARLFEPLSFDARAEGGLQHFPIPPARYHRGQLRTFYHGGYYRSARRYADVPALTEAEAALLDAYDAIAEDPAVHLDMELQPGDIQLLSNHTVVHARTAYRDPADPAQRRHLLRLWLSFPQRTDLGTRWRTLGSKLGLARMLLLAKWQQRGRTAGVA